MKILPEHLTHIECKIEKVLRTNPQAVEMYETGNFPRADKVKNLQVRFNWDLFNAAGLTKYASDVLYEYLNDSHIDTALRKICPNITKRY